MATNENDVRHQQLVQRLPTWVFTVAVAVLVAIPLGTCSLAETVDGDYPTIFDDLGPHLRNYYWDLRRVQPKRQFDRALAALENVADEVYVEFAGIGNSTVRVHAGEKSTLVSLNKVASLDSAFTQLSRIFTFLDENYDGKTPLNDVRIATVNGFLTGLDPHTMVFSKKAFEEFYVHIEGNIFGVGMLVGTKKDGQLRVIQVLKGTPAMRAGFRNGDLIVKIDDESTINMNVNEAVQLIRGEEDTAVILTVKRKNKDGKLESIKIPVTRARVIIKSVESKLLPDDIGYVNVRNFDSHTVQSLKETIDRKLTDGGKRKLRGLLLDLRGNSGGLLKQASDMVDYFLKSGEIYSVANYTREPESTFATDDGQEPSYPVIALCDEASASGAEIVIGSLQQNERALVLGSPTFGKGSVQQLHPLPPPKFLSRDYKAQLKITVSEYLIPNRISIQGKGVVPDIFAHRVFFGENGAIDYFPNDRRGTEEGYEHHIVSKYAKELTPAGELHYAHVYTPPDEDFVGDEFMSGDIKPLKDKLVQVAVRLMELHIKNGGGATVSGKSFVTRHKEDLGVIRQELAAEISSLLKERGTDWANGDNVATAPDVKLEVSHRFDDRPSGDEDDPFPHRYLVVTARAKNVSGKPIYNLAGETDSDQHLYTEREFLFGKVDPGQTVERSFEVRLRPASATRSDVIPVELRCPGVERPFAPTEHEVVIIGEDFPEFSYSLTLFDAEKGTKAKRLAPGTKAKLVARIENIGDAAVRRGIAVLKNKSGKDIFLDVGRLEVNDLEAGSWREFEFEFNVRGDAAREAYDFEFGVYGSHYPIGLSREFAIAGPTGEQSMEFQNGKVERASNMDLTVAYQKDGATTKTTNRDVIVTDDESVTLSAAIDDALSPFQAWVSISHLGVKDNDLPDKISFAESESEKIHKLQLSTKVPLKVGQNVISVVSRNDRGLLRRGIVYVRRTMGATTAAK